MPTSLQEQVLGQLAKDPNVVPLLQAIVQYVYKTNLVPAQSRLLKPVSETPTDDVRPIKRRRLQRVPAGAEGWTVPFPFQQGEGPQHYRETWEMKRLIVLLGSLIRNLKNWRSRHGTVSFNTQPRKRTFRNKQAQNPAPSSSSTPVAQNSPTNPPVDEDFFAQLQIPNPSEFDLSLDSLLGVLTSYDGRNDSALNVDLGALSLGAPISDIFFTTPASSEQTISWADYALLSGTSNTTTLPDFQMDQLGTSIPPVDAAPSDTPKYNPAGFPPPPLGPADDTVMYGASIDQYQFPISGLGLDIPGPQMYQDQGAMIPEDELQSLLSMTISSQPFTPSASDSPSIATPEDIATPQMRSPKQPFDMDTVNSSVPAATSLTVAAVSKRGRPRTTAALRRDLNKQLRQNPAESAASSPRPMPAIPLAPPSTSGSKKKTKKPRATEATIKSRQEVLERAKEWRELLAKELENARMARWEVMMEGMVLREIGALVRSGETNGEIDRKSVV